MHVCDPLNKGWKFQSWVFIFAWDHMVSPAGMGLDLLKDTDGPAGTGWGPVPLPDTQGQIQLCSLLGNWRPGGVTSSGLVIFIYYTELLDKDSSLWQFKIMAANSLMLFPFSFGVCVFSLGSDWAETASASRRQQCFSISL